LFNRFTNKLFRFLASLNLAVAVLSGLTLSLAVATTLESYYDTPTAQYWVYRALWFRTLLGLLGVNIFTVAMSRWPWKRRHTPFLLAHLGILMMLFGAWMTDKFGLDGSLRLPEGLSSAVVEVDKPQLVISDQKDVRVVPFRWQPPSVSFKPMDLRSKGVPYDVKVDKFLSHAEAQFYWVPARTKSQPGPQPAVQLNVAGGPMRISQDLWLWTGDPSTRSISMGPAWFAIGMVEPPHRDGAPGILFTPSADGTELSYLIRTSDGKTSKGKMKADEAKDKAIDPGWKGGVKLTIKQMIADASAMANYNPAHTQWGANAPPSAIHVTSGNGGEGREVWLGLGDRAVLKSDAGELELGYLNERVMMPFAMKLNRFQIDKNPGTDDPAAYSSKVQVEDGTSQPETLISMNEPLKYKGLTVYQASYENSQDPSTRPTVSIFAVNRDPGRPWKYWGSILIVGGAILLFAMKYYGKKVQAKKEAA
jgi:hypothetical protein